MRLRLVGTMTGIALCCLARLAHGQSCDTGNPCMTNGMCMSDGTCQGTPVTGGSCEVPAVVADATCIVSPGTCMNGVCKGTPAPVGPSCAAGCGTCQTVAPGVPLTLCKITPGQAGKSCETGLGSCFTGVCSGEIYALCQVGYKTCPDIDHNPCTTDACNPATGQCEHSDLPPCVPTCETCNPTTGQCEPANEGVACEFTGQCKVESHCEPLDTGAGVRGVCVPGAATVPSPTPEVGSPSPTPTPSPLPPGPTATPSELPPTETPTATTPTPGGCTGDCDGNHLVAANEIIQLVQFAQGLATDLSGCPHGIPAGITVASQVTIAHLIQAVNNAQSGCNG